MQGGSGRLTCILVAVPYFCPIFNISVSSHPYYRVTDVTLPSCMMAVSTELRWLEEQDLDVETFSFFNAIKNCCLLVVIAGINSNKISML
jgi:hypothetical protein